MLLVNTEDQSLALLGNAASSFDLRLIRRHHAYLIGSEAAVVAHEGHDDHLLHMTRLSHGYLEVGDIRQAHAGLALLAAGMARSAHHHHLHITPSLHAYLLIRIHGGAVEVLVL